MQVSIEYAKDFSNNEKQQQQFEYITDSLKQLLILNDHLSKKYPDWISQENSDYSCPPENIPAAVQRVMNYCARKRLKARFCHVESSYYSWSLRKRACRLEAPSIAHLCKSVIFENTHCKNQDCSDPLNSRYYCVLVQYISKLNTQKLQNFVKSLPTESTLSKKWYNMRVASEEDSARLSGYEKNGVCPLAMLEHRMPVIIDSDIVDTLKPACLFLGAGDVDWKICLRTEDLILDLNAWVVDLH